jgi:hypothetical protein
MSDSQHRRSRTGTEYEWRWKDETENRPLPESWATNGRHEPIEDDEKAFYGIQYRFGVRLEYEVDGGTGEPTGLPNREEAACRVMYVVPDGTRAVVEEWDAEREADGWKPTSDFASIIAKPPEAGESVAEAHREHYRKLCRERYESS